MSEEGRGAPERRAARARREHELGRAGSGAGPLVLAFGGLHGNEAQGPDALRRVLTRIEEEGLELDGELVAYAGNLQALALGQRYVEDDLNRIWRAGVIADALAAPSAAELTAERRELRELVDALTAELARDPERRVVLLDLHSSSAPGAPFVVMGDTLQNRRLAFALRTPVILGLEENVAGTLLSWFGEQGYGAVGFEGGRHDDPDTGAHHEAAVWLVLEAAGLLGGRAPSVTAEARKRLERAARGLPRFVGVTLRHAVRPEDGFRMEPGYRNFDPVRRGERLATDASGPVAAPFTGRVLLPLYQGQGEDGFFLGRPVRALWLGLSALLRRLQLERALPLLPGVRRDPEVEGGLVVDRRVARLRALDLLHLLGYWRRREDGPVLRVARRREGR